MIKKSKLGDVHNEIALTLNNLGNSYKHLGELEKAQKFFTDALAILYFLFTIFLFYLTKFVDNRCMVIKIML